jgi:hypothetical protein
MLPGASPTEPLLSEEEEYIAKPSEIAKDNEALIRHIYQEAKEIALRGDNPIYRSDLFYNMIPDQGLWCMSMEHPLSELMELMNLRFTNVIINRELTSPLIMWHHDVVLFAMDVMLVEFQRLRLPCSDNCAPKEEQKLEMEVQVVEDSPPVVQSHVEMNEVYTPAPAISTFNNGATNKKNE